MEYFYFETVEERNAFFLECLERGIWAEISYGMELEGVKVDIERTFLQKNAICGMVQ